MSIFPSTARSWLLPGVNVGRYTLILCIKRKIDDLSGMSFFRALLALSNSSSQGTCRESLRGILDPFTVPRT